MYAIDPYFKKLSSDEWSAFTKWLRDYYDCRIIDLTRVQQKDAYCSFRDELSMEEDPDAHSCRDNADADGICSVCGAVLFGGIAYCEMYGCDPPGTT